MRFTVGGQTLDLTKEQVVAAMKGVPIEPIQKHVVEVDGQFFPPKQVFATVTGRARQSFTTMEAQRVLTRLGFECRRAGQLHGRTSGGAPVGGNGGTASIPDDGIAFLEGAVGTRLDGLQVNRWWEADFDERYWLEITDRVDLGNDLNAPQRGDNGREFWGYSLIREIQDGDVIFHYHKEESAIVAWSLASGEVWEDIVVWGAHGTAAREAGVLPYAREGWRLGLEHFTRLAKPVALADMRSHESDIRLVAETLQTAHGGSLYFPFALSSKRPLRPTQGYLAKLPAEMVDLFPSLADVMMEAMEIRNSPSPPAAAPNETQPSLGTSYRQADEETAVSNRDPFTVDPALVERALQGHAKTQNALAAAVLAQGFEPRSPRAGEPNFDLCWVSNEMVSVAEIKSLTPASEEKQMRLGLGQVLRYRQLLGRDGANVRAILAVEHKPSDEGWISLCAELGVALVFPENFSEIFGAA